MKLDRNKEHSNFHRGVFLPPENYLANKPLHWYNNRSAKLASAVITSAVLIKLLLIGIGTKIPLWIFGFMY